LIFDMEHPWGKELQVCSTKVPGVKKWPYSTRTHFDIGLNSKNL